jgi:hypothetical protein
MVAVLLSTLHPSAERIDGSGGDDGRDVQIREGERVDLFELKSFTGRVSPDKGRRRQVERSLKTAASLRPTSWTLVVPIDPSPAEEKWFNKLRRLEWLEGEEQRTIDFPIYWRGKTWLDRQMGLHPSIRRYFLEGGDNEAMRALREIGREQAALADGVPDAIDRLQTLRSRIDEIDPHYRADIHLVGNETRVDLVPRYRGAEDDRPIVLTGQFSLPATELGRRTAEQLQAALDFGEEVEIPGEFARDMHLDAPAGLGVDLADGTLYLGPTLSANQAPLDARLSVLSPDGKRLASLPVRFSERRTGAAGGSLTGEDLTGCFRVKVRIDERRRRGDFSFSFRIVADLLPGALLPVLRTAIHFQDPNLVHLVLTDTGADFGDPVALASSPVVNPAMVTLIEDLEKIQAVTATPFPVPTELTADDVGQIRHAARLISGETVEVDTTKISTVLIPAESLHDWLLNDTAEQVYSHHPNYSVKITGVEVPLGAASLHVPAVRVENRNKLLAAYPWPANSDVQVVFTPEPDVRARIRLVDSLTPKPDGGPSSDAN